MQRQIGNIRANGHYNKSQSCYSHTDCNLFRSRWFTSTSTLTSKYSHYHRSKEHHKERIQRLEQFSRDRHSKEIKIGVFFCKECQCQTILMEREPEENNNTKYSKQSINTLFYLLCTHLHYRCSGIALIGNSFLTWIREVLLIQHIDKK